MTTRPHPGTVASLNPEPELIKEVRALVSNGTARRNAVARLKAQEPDRQQIEAAHTYWIRQMPRFDWDDYTGTHILMILEDLLREFPRGE